MNRPVFKQMLTGNKRFLGYSNKSQPSHINKEFWECEISIAILDVSCQYVLVLHMNFMPCLKCDLSSHGEGEVGTSLDDAWLRGETSAAADSYWLTGSPTEQGSLFISVGNRHHLAIWYFIWSWSTGLIQFFVRSGTQRASYQCVCGHTPFTIDTDIYIYIVGRILTSMWLHWKDSGTPHSWPYEHHFQVSELLWISIIQPTSNDLLFIIYHF